MPKQTVTIARPTVCNQGTKEDVRRLHCEMELPHSIHSLYIAISYSFCLKWLARLSLTIQVNEYIYHPSLFEDTKVIHMSFMSSLYLLSKKKGCMEVSNTPKYNRLSKHYAWYNFTEETLTLMFM